MKLGNAFGGGMGLMGETCGAVTGAFILLGLRFGAPDAADKAAKARTYELVKQFAAEFGERNGSITCRELLGFDIVLKDRSPDSDRIISEKCSGFIRDSIEILGDIFDKEGGINGEEKK